MIGLDTNVVVRLVVGDDPGQTERAKRFVRRRCTPDSPGFISNIVLVELVWVLTRAYGFQGADIVNAIQALLAGADRVVEDPDAVRGALEDQKSDRADLVDSLLGRITRARGCEATATFDRRAARLDTFVAVA